MAEVKKKVDLEIKSNLDKLVAQSSNLNNSMGKLYEQMEKFTAAMEKNSSKSLKAAKEELSVYKKQVEAKQKQSKAEKELLAIQEKYKKQVQDINTKTSLAARTITNIGSGNLGGIFRDVQNVVKGKVIKAATAKPSAAILAGFREDEAKIDARSEKIKGYKEQLAALDPTKKSDKAAIKRIKGNIKYNEDKLGVEQAALAKKVSTVAGGKAAAAGAAAAGALAVVAAIGIVVAKGLKAIDKTFKDMLGVSLGIKDNFNAVVKNVSSILNKDTGAATYATSSSLITNVQARTQQMKYGLTDAQNYALKQTMTMLGMQSDEDLMYMNREQLRLFRSFMNKYSSWYNDMKSSGVLQKVQEFQLDFQMFRQELAMDFMQWFAENKDSILGALKTIAKVTMGIADALLKIFGGAASALSSLFGSTSGNLSASMSDYSAGRGSSSVKNININVNQNNNATGVLSSQTALENFFNDQMSKLSQEWVAEIS